MRVAIVDVLGSPYDGSTTFKRGLGGSESAVVYIAKELKKLGMIVHVFNDCEGLDACPGRYDGVEYKPRNYIALQSLGYDVVIGSRSVRAFTKHHWSGNPHKVLWMHDTFCDGDDQVESLVTQGMIDEIWTLSDWHTTYVSQCTHGHRRMMEALKRKIWVTRNGVNLWQEADLRKKEKNHFIFNAAVSKGMETLLNDVWPRVKEQIPSAELTVVGGAYPLRENDVQNDLLNDLVNKHNEKNDVLFTGIIPQEEIAELLQRAAFFIYPQSFPETFGISTVESLAYGTPVISGRFGAMEETALDQACYLMDYPVDSNVLYTFNKENHLRVFVQMVVDAYNNDYLWQQKCNAALRVREVCGWDKVALQWKQHLWKVTSRYLPVEDYHKVQQINHRTHEIFNKRWSNPEEWGYYHEIEKKLHVVVPFFNASQYLRRCIESIRAQNYENYQVHLINDASTDSSSDIVSQFVYVDDDNLKWTPDGEERFNYHCNDKKQGALTNQVTCINEIIDSGDDDIIVLLDGDDALTNDPNIFKRINREYHNGAEMTYGSCWSEADKIPLIAQEYPNEVFEQKSFKEYRFPWNIPYTHLRTFKRSLFDRIDDSSLRSDSGDYFGPGGDAALFYALLERCDRSGVRALRELNVIYNDLNPINDYKVNSEEQTKNANSILNMNKFTWTTTKGLHVDNSNATEDIDWGDELQNTDTSHVKKWILIAIPTSQNIHPETFKSIYEQEIPEGYVVHFQYFYGYCIDQVRNLIAHYSIENHYDYVFCIDYDMSFPKDTLKKLLSHDKPLVTGLYIQRIPGEHNIELYRLTENGHTRPNISELKNMMEPIDGCGFGCVLIKTEVFKSVGYPYFTYHHAIRMEDTLSEDVDFCNKVREKGFEMWADTTIRCGHHGQTVFEVKNG